MLQIFAKFSSCMLVRVHWRHLSISVRVLLASPEAVALSLTQINTSNNFYLQHHWVLIYFPGRPVLEIKINMFHLMRNHIVSTPYKKQRHQPEFRYKRCSLIIDTCVMYSKSLEEKQSCVFVYTKYQNMHFATNVRTFYGSEDILAESHKNQVKVWFYSWNSGQDLVQVKEVR